LSPGATHFTRIPSGSNSAAIARVSESTAPLLALKHERFIPAVAAIDDMLTNTPCCDCYKCGRYARRDGFVDLTDVTELCAGKGCLSKAITLAPRSRDKDTVAKPMPDEVPVTTATRPLGSPSTLRTSDQQAKSHDLHDPSMKTVPDVAVSRPTIIHRQCFAASGQPRKHREFALSGKARPLTAGMPFPVALRHILKGDTSHPAALYSYRALHHRSTFWPVSD
jgi:hypothetical protein